MEVKNTNSTASINFAEVKVSVDELEVFAAALSYALGKLSDREIESKFGASRDEVEGICEDLSETLAACGKFDLIAA